MLSLGFRCVAGKYSHGVPCTARNSRFVAQVSKAFRQRLLFLANQPKKNRCPSVDHHTQPALSTFERVLSGILVGGSTAKVDVGCREIVHSGWRYLWNGCFSALAYLL